MWICKREPHSWICINFKVKLSPKCNWDFFYECIWVKPSCKSIIIKKEALLRFTVFSFSAQIHFQWECYGHFYTSIKICIFKTLRRLDTTWDSARSITRVSTRSSTEPHTIYSATANVSCPKTFFLVTLCTQTMFSVLVFMCRDPGDATSKVSCCVETSYCFKHRDFNASVKVAVAPHWKWVWPENESTVNLESASFIIIVLLHEGLTHIHSHK